MPPPPPPPPGPPPPPAPPMTIAPSPTVDPKNRNLLLQSIRQGTTLKKTVTKDRSAPLIDGKPNGGQKSRWDSQESKNIKCATIARTNGLAGLFADGMPKLKPTGMNLGQLPSSSLSSLPVSNHSTLHNSIANLKAELSKRTIDTKNRGPPPQPPPPPNQKPGFPTSASDSTLTITPGSHTRSVSNVSLQNGGKPSKPSKPLLAPKPPAPAPPRKPPNRTQSMRVPASPPVLPPNANAPVFPMSTTELNRIQPSHHFSTESLLRMRPRPLRPPQSRPPPPPRSNPPPPPPPSQPPPPPPPHRTSPTVINRIAPPLPIGVPPQPPHRHSSIRNGSMTSINGDFETRYENMFHPVKDFPPPPPFMGVLKVYNSKTAKQQAPQPPGVTQPVLQLGPKMWTRDTSTC